MKITSSLLLIIGLTISQYSNAQKPEHLDCVKLNHLYRKACHNCYDPSVVHNSFYQSLGMTGVVELDVHSHESWSSITTPSQAPRGVWYVRHLSTPGSNNNYNNCYNKSNGLPNQNFNICLENVQKWHFENPNHDPIIVFLDLKRRGMFGANGPFWRGNHLPTDLNNVLEHFAFDIGGESVIYKPSDLRGSFSSTREAAQNQNWPSLGDLKNKIIFVLTGANADLNKYVSDLKILNRNAMAFIAVSPDAFSNSINGFIPQGINHTVKQDVVFYNLKSDQIDIAKNYLSKNGFISRSWQSESTSSSQYGNHIYNKVNNIAIKNVWANDLNTHMDFQLIGINNITVGGTKTVPQIINSQYDGILQHALVSVNTKNLVIKSGTNYNISAGQNVLLQEGTKIMSGANTTISIGNCTQYPNFMMEEELIENAKTLTKNIANQNDLEFNESLNIEFGEAKKLKIHPNPNNGQFNIQLSNTESNANIEIFDMTGKLVFHENEVSDGITVDIQNQPRGMYFVKITIGEEVFNEKVIFQ